MNKENSTNTSEVIEDNPREVAQDHCLSLHTFFFGDAPELGETEAQ